MNNNKKEFEEFQTNQEILEQIKVLTEVVNANKDFVMGSEKILNQANEKISELIQKLQ